MSVDVRWLRRRRAAQRLVCILDGLDWEERCNSLESFLESLEKEGVEAMEIELEASYLAFEEEGVDE